MHSTQKVQAKNKCTKAKTQAHSKKSSKHKQKKLSTKKKYKQKQKQKQWVRGKTKKHEIPPPPQKKKKKDTQKKRTANKKKKQKAKKKMTQSKEKVRNKTMKFWSLSKLIMLERLRGVPLCVQCDGHDLWLNTTTSCRWTSVSHFQPLESTRVRRHQTKGNSGSRPPHKHTFRRGTRVTCW